ncbi:hypothetical protein ASPWEDRAFT_173325 [Aspergillus wentii DTO 134E9]|uniref:FAD dependent oxidoreductase domain-containing protein n=1 Tax=Aspergillus wentii DTO 134E9 TaxID=1073089 RepID=A0A1L9RG40_ASPWE|nr:uncharacterized protein ASPWEDRAFT_173325 [Aspergillus wentii DTO 134E9]KAI9925653.1 hypothetical protein MW887_006036 [Aspergillus wentii]OJJ33891.1 hypothetical protein ASPWEDRAFT_173325 [Aspergillus wentii DTO 134E9]
MSFVQVLLSNPALSPQERQAALDRIFSDPGIPDANRTTSSFWLRHPHPELAGIRSSSLPAEADVVIIGSGITGASVAKALLECTAQDKPRVVVLEARDICSGATGRNGGHALETAEEFADLEERIGLESARKVMRFKLAHLNEFIQVAEEYGLTEEAQVRKVEFLSTYFDEMRWMEAKGAISRFKECMPEESREWKILEKDDIPTEFHLPHAYGIISGPAGALWPYKYITGIFAHLQHQFPNNLSIETNTPVTDITKTSNPTHPYTLTTPRGAIRTRHIIHCTNAHAARLIPDLKGRIYPIRGQMSAQTPGSKFPFQGSHHSWIFNYEKGFDYLTQLPHSAHSAGEMMLGGGFAQGEVCGTADMGISSDDELSLYADIHLSGALGAVFGRENWGEVAGSAVKMMWTGNMGFSADGLPWVGRLTDFLTRREGGGDAGEWICAAFSGEGMVQAWLSGKALAMMVLDCDKRLALGFSADLTWFPDEMMVSEKRVKEAVLPRFVEGSNMQRGTHL